jgi:CHAT domain-containing protein/tetratricopeptide (TPR) repeat protein
MGDTSLKANDQRALMERSGEKGWAAVQSSDFETAEREYLNAIKYARKLKDLSAEAVFLSYLGLVRQNQGRLPEARKDLEKCLSLAQDAELLKIEAHARFLLGEQYRQLGDTDSAIHQFLGALEAAYSCEDSVGVEMAFGELGLLYLERGWAEQASECFRQALETTPDSPNRAAWLGSLGQCLAELGQYNEAIASYIAAFEEAVSIENPGAQAICLGSQGNALFEQGNVEGAIKCYEKAIELSHEAGDTAREGIWYGNLGNAYRKQLDLSKATEYCQKALQQAQKLGDRHAEAAHLDSLGDCLMQSGDSATALSKYEEALSISKTLADRQGERIYLSNLARAHQRMGQLEPAFDYFSSAIELFDDQRSRIKSDDLKTSFATLGQDLYKDMVQLCLSMGRRVQAVEYVGRAKSRAILDLLSNSPIDVGELAAADDESLQRLVDKESQLRNQIARLERLFWQGPAPETGHRGTTMTPEDTHKLYVQWRDVVNQLRRRHPNYANLVAVETLTFEQIKKLWHESHSGKAKSKSLPDSVAILEYYWAENIFVGAAVWSGCTEPSINFVADAEELKLLEANLADFLEMSSTEGWEVPIGSCRRLYDKLVAPLLQNVPDDVATLIIIPHSCLYRLPFSALHDGAGFLVEKYAISYLPTTSLIPILQKAKRSSKTGSDAGYLVSAISDYSATRSEGMVFSSRLRSAAGLDDLSYTMEEAKTIFDLGSQHSNTAKLLTNQEVKEELPSLFSQYPVVHFAGHAVFNPEEPLASGLVLSDGSMLTAASILQGNALRTNCGKLLVLSACQTGVNMVTTGGEILGLARALMYAGMPNLILSLWEVADRSTANLMKDFHNCWKSGARKRTIAQALQESQIRAIKEKQPIHAWAPFIHLGID